MNILASGGYMVVALLSFVGNLAGRANIVAGQCIPSNDILSGALSPIAELIIGARWGLAGIAAIAVAAWQGLAAIFKARTGEASEHLKAAGIALAVVIVITIAGAIFWIVTGNMPDMPFCPF